MDKTFGKRGNGFIGWAAPVAVMLPLLVAGCAAENLTRPGVTASQQFQDETACHVIADRQAPPKFQTKIDPGFTTEPLYRGTRNTPWGKVEVYTPGQYTPPTPVTVDVNEEARNNIYRNCMAQRGYAPKQ